MPEEKSAPVKEKQAPVPLTTEQRVTTIEEGMKNLEAALVLHQHLPAGGFVVPPQRKP